MRLRLERLAAELSCGLELRQTNDEATLVGWLQEAWDGADGVILNPAAFTHYSYAIRDAIAAISTPVIEVHISNIHARESSRSQSVITAVALGMICGLGTAGTRWHCAPCSRCCGVSTEIFQALTQQASRPPGRRDAHRARRIPPLSGPHIHHPLSYRISGPFPPRRRDCSSRP